MHKKTITFFISLIFFVIYYAGSFSKISFGDGIGFVSDVEAGSFLKDFMPLSHFLYINTAVFISKYLALDSIAVMRMMSVIPAAITVSLVFVLVREVIAENRTAVAAAFVFGLGFTFWRSASTIEIYTFNALWIVLFLICAVKSIKGNRKPYLICAGLLLAFSFWVHIQNILLIPAYIILLYFCRKEGKQTAVSLLCFLVVFGTMFIVNGMQGIEWKYLFTVKEGTWISDTFNQSIGELLKDVVKAFGYLIYNFNIFVIVGLYGVPAFFSKHKTIGIFLFTAGLINLGFATFYAATDNYVFFIPFYLIFAVLIGTGIEELSKNFRVRKLIFLPALTPLFYICCLQIAMLIPKVQAFHRQKEYKGGLTYYMIPWLHNNVGCIEFTLSGNVPGEDVTHLKKSVSHFIKLRSRYQSMAEIREL